MNKIKAIADALRCITLLPGEREMKCEECPYRVLEEIDDKMPISADVEIDGKKYWSDCDCDKISLDAAEVLDKLVAFLERNEELVKLLENAIVSETENRVLHNLLKEGRIAEVILRREIAETFK